MKPKLNPAQLALQKRCRPHAAGIETGRWALAKEALAAKRERVPQWERIIGELPDVRRKDRTIRGWAQTAEWREIVIFGNGKPYSVPFSHYSITARYIDRIAHSDLLDAMETAEQDGMDYESYAVMLSELAQTADSADGRIPPSGDSGKIEYGDYFNDAQSDYGLSPLQFVQQERDRLSRIAALSEFASVAMYLSAAMDALDTALIELGKETA